MNDAAAFKKFIESVADLGNQPALVEDKPGLLVDRCASHFSALVQVYSFATTLADRGAARRELYAEIIVANVRIFAALYDFNTIARAALIVEALMPSRLYGEFDALSSLIVRAKRKMGN